MLQHRSRRLHAGRHQQRLHLTRALLALALFFASSGCTMAGYCCGRLTDFDETTDSDRRKVKREVKEEKREELEEAAEDLLEEAEDRREGDLAAYHAWLSKALDLPAVWQASRTKPGFVREWRLTTLDGAYGDGGGFAGARLVAVPDWSWLITEALKQKFEREFDKGDRDRLARDLWLGERWAVNHLDTGVAGIDIELTVEATDMPPGFAPVKHVLGSARTDLEGRAAIALGPDGVPGWAPPMAYELTGRLVNAPPDSPKLAVDEPGHLFVRRGAAKGVVLLDADDVLDWTRAVSVRAIVNDERFTARDWCVKSALPELAKTHGLAIVAPEPDSLAPVFRKGLSASGATADHPRSIALHFAESRKTVDGRDARVAQLTALAARYESALGDGAIEGLLTTDPALAESFAKQTGERAWTLASPKDGGWCAGVPGLLAPKK